MKTIEEIRDLSFDSLEQIADNRDIRVPEGLTGRLESTLLASDTLSVEPAKAYGRRNLRLTVVLPAIAAAAAIALVLILPGRPKDTYSDPLLAYAELEKTFSYISSKMERGLEIASEAGPVIEKTNETINKAK